MAPVARALQHGTSCGGRAGGVAPAAAAARHQRRRARSAASTGPTCTHVAPSHPPHACAPQCCQQQWSAAVGLRVRAQPQRTAIMAGATPGSRGGRQSSAAAGPVSDSGWQQRLYGGDAPEDGSAPRPKPRGTRNGGDGRGGGRGRGGNRQRDRERPAPSASSTPAASGGTDGPPDFVVVKKGPAPEAAGGYIQSTQQLQVQQDDELDGSRYWSAALADDDGGYDDDDDSDADDAGGYDEDDDQGSDRDAGDEEADEDEVGMEEVVSLLQDLAAGLEDEGAGTAPGADGSSSSSAYAAAWRQALLGGGAAPLTLGPVAVKHSAGRGRGLFTTAAVAAGDVLLTGAPLALLYCEEGATPENEELAAHLAALAAAAVGGSSGGGLAPWQQRALLQLRGPGEQQQQQEQQVPDLQQLLGPPDERVWVDGQLQAQQEEAKQQQQQQQQQLSDAAQLTRLAFANCTGEEFEDQALVLLRGATSCGHLGVWPAAALVNHSCSPNCHSMLVGERLMVRAGRDIPANTEVTLSYLGPQLFAPAVVRQAELRQQWGFDCGCARCKAEARYAGTASSSGSSTSSSSSSSSGSGSSGNGNAAASLAQLLQETHAACQALGPELDAAIAADDGGAIRRLQRQLLDMQAAVDGGVRAAKPPAHARRWLQACVYELYDLISMAADQLPQQAARSTKSSGGRGRGGSSSSCRGRGRGAGSAAGAATVDTEALAACARIVGDLTPGSSAHVELATEYMVRAEARFGAEHQEAADAARLCAAALTARYAPISPGVLQLLMDTWAGAALI